MLRCTIIVGIVALAVLYEYPCTAAIEWQKESLRAVYDPAGEFYCYAPALLREDGRDTILACHNQRAGLIRDEVVLVRPGADCATTTHTILTAGPDKGWDGFHVCDPSVISGSFRYRGEKYTHALFYLGNDTDASINNQIGVAFSRTWEGPWHRLPRPLIALTLAGGWGVGQPSAVLDAQGRLLLFYTKETPWTYGYVREVHLGDADAPRLGAEYALPSGGVLNTNGKPDYWNNFDVAYDASRGRFWAIREQHPYPADQPTNISDTLELLSIEAASLFNADASWRVEGQLSPDVTGHARNHNACFERTVTGTLPDSNRIRVLFSTSCAGKDCGGKNPLWTYDLWEISGTIVSPSGKMPDKTDELHGTPN